MSDQPHKYRLLMRGEVIQRGDQPIDDGCEAWVELAGWEIGMEYSPNVLKPVRRLLQRENEEALIAEAERNRARRS